MSNLTPRGTIKGIIRSGGGGGVTDYDQLTGRPQINSNILTGDKGGHDLGLMNINDIDITKIYDITHGYNYNIEILGEAIHITDQTFKPATAGEAGASGLVPRPTAGDNGKILSNEGWIDLPIDNGVTYDNTEKIIGTYFGKTLYEKSYMNIAGTGTTVNVILSDLTNIETIFIVPEASNSTDGYPFPYIHPSVSNIIGGFFIINGGIPTLNIRRGSDAAGIALKYLTVRYTKTT